MCRGLSRMNETHPILHHFPQSLASERIRVALGIKQLNYSSVTVPMVPPKPSLTPLTGGYRRTPVLQLGADIYCDTRAILDALDRHWPEQSLTGGRNSGLGQIIGRWSDGPLFRLTLQLVIGENYDSLSEDYLEDRRLLFFPEYEEISSFKGLVGHFSSQLVAELSWLNEALSGGGEYLLGDRPGLSDIYAYNAVWFLRYRWSEGPRKLAMFPSLIAWEHRISSIGHGHPRSIEAKQALACASSADPTRNEKKHLLDDEWSYGDPATVVPDLGASDPIVFGQIEFLDVNSIALSHENDVVGQVVTWFPRTGYRIEKHALESPHV